MLVRLAYSAYERRNPAARAAAWQGIAPQTAITRRLAAYWGRQQRRRG